MDIQKVPVAKRLKTERATSTFVAPLTKGELASLAIESRQKMGLSLDTLIAAKADSNIGEGRGRSQTPITFRFDVAELAQAEMVEFLRKQAITLQADSPDLGWTLPTDHGLKNPTQTVANRLASMLADHDLKLRVTIDEKRKSLKIQIHSLSLSEYEKRQAAKKAAKAAETQSETATSVSDDSSEEE